MIVQKLKNDEMICFGYARVSTDQQTTGLESQIRAIQEYCKQNGIDKYKLFQDENISGAKTRRPALDKMMKEIEEGKCNMIVVFSFSRFSRSCTHLLKSLEYLKEKNVNFVSVSERIDTNTPMGKALFAILGAVAQLERDLIRERVVCGLKNAKAKGIVLGRPKTRPSTLIRRLRASGLTYRECARIAKCSTGAVASEVKKWKQELKEGIVSMERDNISEEKPKQENIDKAETELEFEIVRY